jgi:hypothetical protein
METAVVVRGRTFGTEDPRRALVLVVRETELDPAPGTWPLPGVEYTASARTIAWSDAGGRFEFSRITSILRLHHEASTVFSLPGYRERKVSGTHGQILRVVLLRERQP